MAMLKILEVSTTKPAEKVPRWLGVVEGCLVNDWGQSFDTC